MSSRFYLFFFLTPLAISAADLTLPLEAIPRRVVENHPDLKAAHIAVKQAKARQLGAGRLENPTASFDWRTESRLSPSEGVFTLDQSFPVTRRLSLERKLTSELVTAAELEVRNAERLAISTAQELAIQLLAIRGQKALRVQQTTLAAKLSDFAKERSKAGEVSSLDAAQAHLDTQRLQVEARRLDNESISLLGRLKPMLGLQPSSSLEVSGELPGMRIPATRKNGSQRADYVLSQKKIETSRIGVDLAKSNKWKDLTVGLVGGPEAQSLGGSGQTRTGFLGMRLSIPLPLWNRNESEQAEQAANVERAQLESTAILSQIESDADTARREMIALSAMAKETREKLLPLANEQTNSLKKAYENGQTELATLLRASDQRLQLEAAALDAERDFHLARIRYESATGIHAPAP